MNTMPLIRSLIPLALLAAPCSAVPIMFENLDHAFAWISATDGDCAGSGSCIAGNWLNVTLSAAAQAPASPAPGAFKPRIWNTPMFPSVYDQSLVSAPVGSTGVAVGPPCPIQDMWASGTVSPVLQLHRGDIVGPSLTYGAQKYVLRRVVAHVLFKTQDQTCFGVSFTLADGVHYGWIQGTRTGLSTWNAERWAYESEPGVPITIPDVASPPINPPPDSPTTFSNAAFDFAWTPRDEQSPASVPGQWLDMTLAADAQTGAETETGLLYSYNFPTVSTQPKSDSLVGALRVFIATGAPQMFTNASGTQTITVAPPRSMAEGELIGQALNFVSSAPVFLRWLSENLFLHLVPDRAYFAIRVSMVDGAHYGWIEVVPRISASQPWALLRWAVHPIPDVAVIVPALSPIQAFPPFCPDLNGDHVIGAADLGILLGSWGTSGVGDLDGDGVANSHDLALMLASWGPCP